MDWANRQNIGLSGLGRTGRTRADWEAWGGRASGLGGQIGMHTSWSTGLFAS